MSDGTALLVALLLLAGNAFFVGAEFALVSARRSQIEPLAEAGNRRAVITIDAMENVSLMMAGAQLGITVCSLGLGATAEPAIAHLIEPLLEDLGISSALVHPIAFVLALSLVVFLHMVLGEMVPKNIALAGPERSAMALGPPLRAIVTALRPFIAGLNAVANLVLRMLRVEPQDEVASAFTRDEVATMINEASREGMLDEDEASLLEGALDLSEAVAGDLLIPIDQLTTVDASAPTHALYDAAVRSGFSRFPVRDADGTPSAYVHIRDALAQRDATSTDHWLVAGVVGDLPLRQLPSVPVDLPVTAVVTTMRDESAHLARVTDSSGDVVGVVALEDALERMIGEVRDPAHRRRH